MSFQNCRMFIAPAMLAATTITIMSVAHAATPSASPTVKVGNQIKNAVGTVIGLNQGDTACTMTLKDDAGKAFSESADFDLCNQKPSLKGQRVQLDYKMANVQSAQCQGDPNCRKSDRIALVTSATVLGKASASQGAPAASRQSSFCTSTETIVFACQTGSKLVSVCASRTLSPKAGYVQYRFGKPGEPLEITLPAGEVHPLKAAYGAFDGYAGGGASWMRFRKGSFSYVVYGGVGRWGPKGETMEKQGLAVENNGKVIANLKCDGKSDGELGPNWFEKAGYARSDKEEFYIPD